jgi:histidine triad (HIT) family protein
MASIFSKIVAGDIPCHRIAENDEFLAFLDIQPLAEGHTLVIPKKEIDYFFDLAEGLLSRINLFERPNLDVTQERLAATAERIRKA